LLLINKGKSRNDESILVDIKPEIKKPIFLKNGSKLKNLLSKKIKTLILFFLKKFIKNLIKVFLVIFFIKKFISIVQKKLK